MRASNHFSISLKVAFLGIISLTLTAFITPIHFVQADDAGHLSSTMTQLLKKDASGMRVPSEKKCFLNQKALSSDAPFITTEYSNEVIPKSLMHSIKDGEYFEIKSVTPTESDQQVFNVEFALMNSKKKTLLTDHMLVIKHTSEKKISRYGEYEILSPPNNFFIYENCQ